MEKQLKKEILADLSPEELEPRLELQLVINPIPSHTTANDNNCSGGTCNVKPNVT